MQWGRIIPFFSLKVIPSVLIQMADSWAHQKNRTTYNNCSLVTEKCKYPTALCLCSGLMVVCL